MDSSKSSPVTPDLRRMAAIRKNVIAYFEQRIPEKKNPSIAGAGCAFAVALILLISILRKMYSGKGACLYAAHAGRTVGHKR